MKSSSSFDETSIEQIFSVAILIIILGGMLSPIGLQSFFDSVEPVEPSPLQHQQLQHITHTIIDDIHRAGFWQATLTHVDSNSSSIASEPVLLISEKDDEPHNSCISYLYGNNTQQHRKKTWLTRYGFRLNNNVIEYYEGPAKDFSCNKHLYWTSITDPAIMAIANMQFLPSANECINLNTWVTFKESVCAEISTRMFDRSPLIEVKQLDVTLSAYLTDDTEDKLTLHKNFRVQSRLNEPL